MLTWKNYSAKPGLGKQNKFITKVEEL